MTISDKSSIECDDASLGAAGKKGGPLGEVCCSSHIKVMRSLEALADGDWGAEAVELLFFLWSAPQTISSYSQAGLLRFRGARQIGGVRGTRY